jgi:hypothetical protein
VEALAAKALSEGGVWLYEKTRSYPQYNFYAYRDKCAACRVSDAKALGLDRISSWIAGGCAPDFEFSVLKAGIDILYATYYRYLDVDGQTSLLMIEPTEPLQFQCRMCPIMAIRTRASRHISPTPPRRLWSLAFSRGSSIRSTT